MVSSLSGGRALGGAHAAIERPRRRRLGANKCEVLSSNRVVIAAALFGRRSFIYPGAEDERSAQTMAVSLPPECAEVSLKPFTSIETMNT